MPIVTSSPKHSPLPKVVAILSKAGSEKKEADDDVVGAMGAKLPKIMGESLTEAGVGKGEVDASEEKGEIDDDTDSVVFDSNIWCF